MSQVEAFIADPSQESLDKCTKEHLLKVAAHYSVEVEGDKRLKENVKAAIRDKLFEDGIMSEAKMNFSPDPPAVSFQTHGLSFEQQRGIGLMQTLPSCFRVFYQERRRRHIHL